MQKNRIKHLPPLRIFLVSISILTAMIFSAGCVKNVRPPLSVCIQRVDWTDEALDNLNDKNKVAVLVLSDYCELKLD